MHLGGVFKEIERPSRLAYTWAWEGMASQTLVTIEFREVEGDTEILLTQEPFKNAEEVALHDQGWNGGFDKLDEILRRKKDGKA
jgi:glutathione S-transferase